MRYTVIWKPDAEDELALIWTNATDRDAVTQAADTIDQMLEIEPGSKGESRPGGRRIAFIEPLAVIFRVYKKTRKVSVLHVWRY